MRSLMRRVAPAFLLVVLAPVIAEFLLGDFSVRSLGLIGWGVLRTRRAESAAAALPVSA